MTDYSIKHSPTGALTLFDSATGEYLHRFFGPEHESRMLYALGCRIHQRKGELCIGDLGLGAGFNVLAALHEIEQNNSLSQVNIYSFDTTLGGLRLFADNSELFGSFSCYESIAKEALRAFEVNVSQQPKSMCFQLRNKVPVVWQYCSGDARKTIKELDKKIHFHALFYDFFSCQKTEDLWLRGTFELFASRLARDGILATYSSATPVRAILLSLGLFVGEGAPVSNALKGTLASPSLDSIHTPLDWRWLQRFSRSQRKFFALEDDQTKALIERRVLEHRQFEGK